jgi:alanine racemase
LRTQVSRLRWLEPGEGVGYDHTWRAPAPGQRRPDDPGGALVATLPIGYADGYKRGMSNTAEVLVRGTRAPVVGLVNMDQCAVDVTAVPDAAEGDDVLLLGTGPEGEIPVLDLAQKAGTNRNEILAAIGRRVPRLYFEKGQLVRVVDYLLG